MRKLLLLVNLFVFSAHAYAQMTQYCIGDAGNQIATRVRYLPADSSTIIAGYTYDMAAGTASNCQAIVMKVTNAGTIAWQKTFGVPALNNIIMDMIITQDNNIVIVGTVGGTGAVYADNTAAILKFNSTNGTLMWQTCLRDAATTVGGELFFSVTELADGTGRLVAVGAHDYTSNGADGMICVFQGTGALIYNDVYQIANGDEFESVTTSADGASVYICGEFVGDYKDGRVFSYTPGTTTGNINWSQYFDFYIYGTLQDNFFSGIYLSGTKLVVAGSAFMDYTSSGGLGCSVLTLNAADGSGAQLSAIQNSAAAYTNSPNLAVVSADHIFTIQSPATAYYDPVLWTPGITTSTVLTEITSLSAKTTNTPVRFTSADVGEHSVLDIRVNGSTLYLAGSTNVTSGFGNNDIYYVATGTGLASLNGTCDTVHDNISITNPVFTNPLPSFDTIHFIPVYSTVDTATTNFNIKAICGDDIVISNTCNTLTMPDSIKFCDDSTFTMPATISGTDSVISYSWSPATGLSNTTILNPVINATTSGWYDLTVQSLIPDNLVVNGNFAAGNTGFSSAYIWSPPPSTVLNEGYYSVYNNPYGVHTGFLSMSSYPVAGGNMLIINGGSTASSVWCETIPVTPNTNYDFSAWFADCSSVTVGAFVPVLQFEVNGVLLGTPTAVTAAPGSWMNFFATWNSGANTIATICIYDETTAANGNDFVIDDISFEPICKVTDSTYVKVSGPDTTSHISDTSVCSLTTSITLNAPAGSSNNIWSTGATATSVTVPANGTYWVESVGYCALLIDTFKIAIAQADTTTTVEDSAFCKNGSIKLNAPTGAGYSSVLWSTGSTATSITVSDTGLYIVKVDTFCGLVQDEFNVSYKPQVIVSVSATVKGCPQELNLFVQPAGNQYNYLWAGPDGFTSSTQNPIIESVSSANQGVYTVTVSDGSISCSTSDTTSVAVHPIIPDTLKNITSTQVINYGSSVQLNADNATYYWWMPDDGSLNNRNINNPIATPTQTTIYTVYGRDSIGCEDSAKILVEVLTDSIMIPSAFTPNGDGLNDVFRPLGMTYQSMVEFDVYNRWGQRVFYTNNKEQGWDGTFNGVKQDMDVYDYMLIVALDDGTNRIYKGNVTLVR